MTTQNADYNFLTDVRLYSHHNKTITNVISHYVLQLVLLKFLSVTLKKIIL